MNFKSLEIIPILFTPESGGKMLKNLISPILKYSLIDQFRVFLFHGLISRGLDVFISTKNKIHKYLRERGEAAPHVLFVLPQMTSEFLIISYLTLFYSNFEPRRDVYNFIFIIPQDQANQNHLLCSMPKIC